MVRSKFRLIIFIVFIMLPFSLLVAGCAKFSGSSTQVQEEKLTAPVESVLYVGDLELPVAGATGYASVPLEVKEAASLASKTIGKLKAGSGFTIVREDGDWLLIQRENLLGWLPSRYCMINLPDVIPSIIYDNTNTYSSKLVSSGRNLPGITGQALYPGKSYNPRLSKEEFIMPVLYSMSKKIHLAQKQALAEGNSLKIYEAYRPHAVQKRISSALQKLASKDRAVMNGISTSVWDISWFIAINLSNHQRGNAIDVSLVKIDAKKNISIGPYSGIAITRYTEFTMPTPIHELSRASVRFTVPVSPKSATAWQKATFAPSMNAAAIKLQAYCTQAGLIPLASEWWHFDDLDARLATQNNSSDGNYMVTECYSSVTVK